MTVTPKPFVSYAPHGEDVVLWRALGDRPSAFYLDVGAFDPTFDSVTRALYERGWRGINIEPQPERLAAFERDRPDDANLALSVGDEDGGATLAQPDAAPLRVPVRRLDTLLTERDVQHVDVLRVNVGAASAAAVRGLLGGRVRPTVCVISVDGDRSSSSHDDDPVALLVDEGYAHCLFDGLNHFLTTDPALVPALSVPANPADGYTTAAVARYEEDQQQLNETIAALAAENLALRENATIISDAAVASVAAVQEAAATRPGTAPAAVAAAALAPAAAAVEPSDLPLPSPDAVIASGSAAADPTELTAAPSAAFLPKDERSARRRSTFQRLMRTELPALVRAPAPGSDAVELDPEALLALGPGDAVEALFTAILGRPADKSGLASWTARVRAGEPLISVARDLAASTEARARPARVRVETRAALHAWEAYEAASLLGISVTRPGRSGAGAGDAAHEIFARALFEVALQRTPAPDELSLEMSKLRSGVGREWLLRAYAQRDELNVRLFGAPPSSLRGRVRRWRDRRRRVEIFRALVQAVEARELAQIRADLTTLPYSGRAAAHSSEGTGAPQPGHTELENR